MARSTMPTEMAKEDERDISSPLCRFCLSANECIEIFDCDMTINQRLDKIIDFLLAKVEDSDGLPNWICRICIGRVEDFVGFEAQCENSYQTFWQWKQDAEQFIALAEQQRKEGELKERLRVWQEKQQQNLQEQKQQVEQSNQQQQQQLQEQTKQRQSPKESTAPLDSEKDEQQPQQLGRKQMVKIVVLPKPVVPLRFNSVTTRDHHESCHQTEKPFTCKQCTKSFYSQRELARHCSPMFASRHLLVDHSKSHQTIGELECDICGSLFKFKRTLAKHIKVHDRWGGSTLTCRVCREVFNFPLKLLQHYRTEHMVEYAMERHAVYRCNICQEATFNDMDMFMEHMSNEHYLKQKSSGKLIGSRFACDHCPMLFRTEAAKLRHSELHKFACTLGGCSRRYKTKQYLQQHMLKMHSELGTARSLMSSLGKGRPPPSNIEDSQSTSSTIDVE